MFVRVYLIKLSRMYFHLNSSVSKPGFTRTAGYVSLAGGSFIGGLHVSWLAEISTLPH